MILGFTIEKIEAAVTGKELKGNFEAKNSLKIKEITEESLEPLAKEKVLKITCSYTVAYEPKIAEIQLVGSMRYRADDKARKEILSKWKKEKKLSPELGEGIMNYALNKCNLKVLYLTQELNLPPHIPFPRLVKKEEKTA